MQPPRYAPSADNIVKLREFTGSKVTVSSLKMAATYDSGCRMMGPIEPADGLSIPDFIAKALNDELKMAGVYAAGGRTLSGSVDRVLFSSSSGLVNGYWDLAVTLQSDNGRTLSAASLYNFKSGFDAATACNATADALSSAVQDLIKVIVNDPAFPALLQ